MKTISVLTVLLMSIVSVNSLAQFDFDHYTSLFSEGPIPEDFTRSTGSKAKEDAETKETDLTNYQKQIFFEEIHYAIDEMLHSGIVVYGDPISNYSTEVMDRLLRDEPELRKELRIYTLKSNTSNAFSTDQGIIFVTTGLVAQITSEAQLAYILAHEISHYKRKHVQETFSWKLSNYKYADQIDKLSNHSKEKEFEADKDAISLYHRAGYPLKGIYETFDVLMYSYLPFEEVTFPLTYFNTERIFIPNYLFPKKKYEIKAEEDYDDSNSSHPNISKRKDSVGLVIGNFQNWGEEEFSLGKDKFELIRDIARFETVRSDILDANYGDALYSIFLLERKYPESHYLARMKAQLWLNLLLYRKENKSNLTIDNISDLEGESAPVHFMLKKMSKDGLITLALRQTFDLSKRYPEDKEINSVYTKLVNELGGIESFKLSTYSQLNYFQAAEEYQKIKNDTTSIQDSIKSQLNKYETIRNQKSSSKSQFDSTRFYLYGIADILNDTAFIELYNSGKSMKEAQKKKEQEAARLTRNERLEKFRIEEENRMKLGIDRIVIVEPKVFSSRGNYGFDPIRSENIETLYSDLMKDISTEIGVNAEIIDRRTLLDRGTEGFNHRNILISLLDQISREDDINVFPVDFQLLNELRTIYGTNKVMFTLVEHQRSANINWYLVGASAVLLPTLPFTLTFYIPRQLFTMNRTELSVLILDLEKGMIDTGSGYFFNEPVYKYNLGAHVYDIFHHIRQEPVR